MPEEGIPEGGAGGWTSQLRTAMTNAEDRALIKGSVVFWLTQFETLVQDHLSHYSVPVGGRAAWQECMVGEASRILVTRKQRRARERLGFQYLPQCCTPSDLTCCTRLYHLRVPLPPSSATGWGPSSWELQVGSSSQP